MKLRVAAPPVEGKANAEVERFMAGVFGLARSQVSVTKGAASRDKAVLVRDVDLERVQKTFGNLPA